MPSDVSFDALLEEYPHLKIWTASSPGYDEARDMYLAENVARPLAVIRPQAEQEVSHIVKYAVKHSIPLTVRSGGHDWKGRSMIEDAIVIDMRDLASVELIDDGVAVVGGGIIGLDLIERLQQSGYMTAIGACGSVGYTGWATHGGYGSFAGKYGLGCDQILGARIVDYQGNIFDADEELLYGIRGGGGAFGVIVSLTVKIYKLSMLLGGAIIYAVDAETQIGEFLDKYHECHTTGGANELMVSAIFQNVPGLGKTMLAASVWASEDIETGRQHLEKWKAIWPVAVDAVTETTPIAWLQSQQPSVPPWGSSSHTGYRSVLLRELGPEPNAVLNQFSKSMPKNAHLATWLEHHVHGVATRPTLSSCYAYREQHILLEILGVNISPDVAKDVISWASGLDDEAHELPQSIKGGYSALTKESIPLEQCFPGHWTKMQQLKAKYDPSNVFRYTISGLTGQV